MTETTQHTHQVIRPIPGMDYRAGDLVDASGWRSATKLERSRYIKPVSDVTALRGRIVELEARIAELEAENRALRQKVGGGGGKR
jgi:hypothetical protein